MVTSNHVHLIVSDNGHRETIPRSIQLVAMRVGQDYNQRKKCKAVFWEEHYHAPAVKSGEHLVQCLIYSDLTMVCAGVASQFTHPGCWLIMIGCRHKGWVNKYVADGKKKREEELIQQYCIRKHWPYVENVKDMLGFRARRRKIRRARSPCSL
jgi:hypothetical protein